MPTDSSMDSWRISEIIGYLYNAAEEPSLWTRALDEVGDALGGAALVTGLHRPQGMAFGVANRLDPDAERVLRDHYADPATNPLFAAMPRLPVLAPVARENIMEDDTYFRSALFNDVFRSQGYVHAALSCLARENGVVIPCGVLRRTNRDFDTDCFRIYETVLPHLRRALELTVRFSDLRAARHHVEAVADAAADGFIVVDASAKVIYSNKRADRVLSSADGLLCRNGILAASRLEETPRLHQLISSAAQRSGYLGGEMRVSRPGTKTPWALVVIPTQEALLGLTGTLGGKALIRLIQLGGKTVAPEKRLMHLFGLSKAEAVIAGSLLNGARPENIAEQRNLRITTVRTHIRSIYLKTGTSRQSDLIRLLAQVANPAQET